LRARASSDIPRAERRRCRCPCRWGSAYWGTAGVTGRSKGKEGCYDGGVQPRRQLLERHPTPIRCAEQARLLSLSWKRPELYAGVCQSDLPRGGRAYAPTMLASLGVCVMWETADVLTAAPLSAACPWGCKSALFPSSPRASAPANRWQSLHQHQLAGPGTADYQDMAAACRQDRYFIPLSNRRTVVSHAPKLRRCVGRMALA